MHIAYAKQTYDKGIKYYTMVKQMYVKYFFHKYPKEIRMLIYNHKVLILL